MVGDSAGIWECFRGRDSHTHVDRSNDRTGGFREGTLYVRVGG